MWEIDDRGLIEEIQRGNVAAFRELVERYKKRIYYLALDLTGNHHDAEDLSQDVFIKVYGSIHKFRMESKIHSWLYRITVNAFIDKKKKKFLKIIRLNSENDAEGRQLMAPVDEGINGDPERHTESKLIQKHINAALNRLSPKEKVVFIMKHYHEQTIKEIAQIINVSEGTVKSTLFRAINKLKTALSFYKEDLGWEDV